MMRSEDTAAAYARPGYGKRLRRGNRPAILVVDFSYAFTDPASRFGHEMAAELAATRRVLDAGRSAGALVIFCVVGYHTNLLDAGICLQKYDAAADLLSGTRAAEVDARLGPRPDELIVEKTMPSALFGSRVPSVLVTHRIDTVVVCGTSTSGCIRATVVDLFSYGFPTLVPRDCVTDIAPGPHEANLFDMDAKYADVIDADEAVRYLESSAPPA